VKWFYRFFPILLILLFSLFAAQKLFTDQFYTSHDGEGHVIRMIEFHEAILDGQLPVRIAKHINHGLGYPFFNFNYPFIYYFGELIHLGGFSYVASFKMTLFLSVFLGGLGIYLFLKRHFDTYAAVTAAIFYIIVPYRFLNMYVRGNTAESFALALVPFFFLCIDLLFTNHKKKYLWFCIVFSLLILSHNITAMLTVFFGGCYYLLLLTQTKQKKQIFTQTLMWGIVALLLTAFFWIPVVVESRLTRLHELMSDYKDFFPTLQEVIYSPWGFGGYKNGISLGKMSPQIGLVQEAVLLLSLMIFGAKVFFRKKIDQTDGFFLYFIGMFFVSLFLLLPVSKFLWDTLSPLQLVQLPWRFLGYITFAAAVAAGYVIYTIRKKIYKILLIALLVGVLMYTNRNHIRVNQYYPFFPPFTANSVYGPSTTSRDEHMPVWAPRIYVSPNQSGDVFPAEAGKSRRDIWKSNYHRFRLNLSKPAAFRDNTSYYPGWTAKIDGKDTEILYTKDTHGRLLVAVPKGQHTVEFFFGETPYRLLADITSIIAFIGLLLWMFFGKSMVKLLSSERH